MKNKKRVRQHLFLIALSIGIASSSISQIAATNSLVSRWILFLNQHDTIALSALYADSAKLQSPNWEGIRTGRSVVRETYSRYFTSTPDMQHKIMDIIATDSAAIIEYFFEGTLLHPEKNTPGYMLGKKYKLAACTVMNIRKGAIISQQTYFDQVSFLRQVGFFDQQ